MTREEELEQAAYSQYCNSESICFTLMCDSFKQGAKWADNHPKSQWISVDDDLPCKHSQLLENINYTQSVLVILSWNDDPTKKHIETAYMCNKIGSFNVNWYWVNRAHYHVTHWMPIPNLN